MPDQPAEPSLSELARTALARARVGSQVTKGCNLRPGTLTVVTVEDQSDGRPLVHLEESSPTVRELGACRVATLSVTSTAPSFRRLELTGPLLPHRPSRPGHRSYRLSPLTVRLVGGTSHSVHTSEFQAARPDPLTALAPAVLQHLAETHVPDLLAWVRAHGHEDAQAVMTRSVDRYGIELAVLEGTGVEQMRLTFPRGPIQHVIGTATAPALRPGRGDAAATESSRRVSRRTTWMIEAEPEPPERPVRARGRGRLWSPSLGWPDVVVEQAALARC